jgi:hypothetical protein
MGVVHSWSHTIFYWSKTRYIHEEVITTGAACRHANLPSLRWTTPASQADPAQLLILAGLETNGWWASLLGELGPASLGAHLPKWCGLQPKSWTESMFPQRRNSTTSHHGSPQQRISPAVISSWNCTMREKGERTQMSPRGGVNRRYQILRKAWTKAKLN